MVTGINFNVDKFLATRGQKLDDIKALIQFSHAFFFPNDPEFIVCAPDNNKHVEWHKHSWGQWHNTFKHIQIFKIFIKNVL